MGAQHWRAIDANEKLGTVINSKPQNLRFRSAHKGFEVVRTIKLATDWLKPRPCDRIARLSVGRVYRSYKIAI